MDWQTCGAFDYLKLRMDVDRMRLVCVNLFECEFETVSRARPCKMGFTNMTLKEACVVGDPLYISKLYKQEKIL